MTAGYFRSYFVQFDKSMIIQNVWVCFSLLKKLGQNRLNCSQFCPIMKAMIIYLLLQTINISVVSSCINLFLYSPYQCLQQVLKIIPKLPQILIMVSPNNFAPPAYLRHHSQITQPLPIQFTILDVD